MSALGLFEKNRFKEGNRLIYSKVRMHEENRSCNTHFSIKYVIRGTEHYRINNQNYRVNSGEYVLVNPGNVHQEMVNSSEEVSGLCISLSAEMLNDVYANVLATETNLLGNPIGFLKNPIDLYETVYGSTFSSLNELLRQLALEANESSTAGLDNFTLYSTIAEHLLASQGRMQKKICRVNAEKYATQKELFRRIEIGRKLIDESYFKGLEIEAIAAVSAMSPYHFSRTFKQVLNLSPYQYLLQKRLEKAKELLTGKQYSISEIAYLIGFSDIYTFSKFFKNAFNLTPTCFRGLQ